MGIDKSFTLKPGASSKLSNPFPFTVTASCVVTSAGSTTLFITAHGSVDFRGKPVPSAGNYCLFIYYY